jgi:hypothetical protein
MPSPAADLASIVATARLLIETKCFLRADGVRARYSAWHEHGTGGFFRRTMIIPQLASPVEVTETLTLAADAVVMVEEVPVVKKRSTFLVTLTERGGLLFRPLVDAPPGFVATECWAVAGKTHCERRMRGADGQIAITTMSEDGDRPTAL